MFGELGVLHELICIIVKIILHLLILFSDKTYYMCKNNGAIIRTIFRYCKYLTIFLKISCFSLKLLMCLLKAENNTNIVDINVKYKTTRFWKSLLVRHNHQSRKQRTICLLLTYRKKTHGPN